MSVNHIGAKLTRRVTRETGLDIRKVWGNGGYVFEFVTTTHEHGWWDMKTGDHGFHDPHKRILHYSTCREMFGNG